MAVAEPRGIKVAVAEPRGMKVAVAEPRGMKVAVAEPIELAGEDKDKTVLPKLLVGPTSALNFIVSTFPI